MAFAHCYLRLFSVAPGIEALGDQCFEDCRYLSAVTFARVSRLKTIGISAFGFCSSLCSICIPAAVEVLSYQSSDRRELLSFVTFESDSRLIRIGREAFIQCPSLKSFCVPKSICSVGIYCFSSCSSLSSMLFEPGSNPQTEFPSSSSVTDGAFFARFVSSQIPLFIDVRIRIETPAHSCPCIVGLCISQIAYSSPLSIRY
jgi:hypothetical protein